LAACSRVIFLPPWHLTTWLDLLDHWQTLVAGLLAIVAAWRTIRATVKSADREVKASQEQTAVALRLERLRAAREGFAFHAMFDAAMGRVLADSRDARAEFSSPGQNPNVAAYIARTRFSKKAFTELRGACVSQGGPLTMQFLDLDVEIDKFASQTQEIPAPGQRMQIGDALGLVDQLGAIEAKAEYLSKEAVAGMERAKVVIAETEPKAA
jgi:hypothetical protein